MDQIFYIRQILEKKWEYNRKVYELFIDFKKACDSIKREVLQNILLEFGIPKKLVGLIKKCLHETYSKVRIGKLLSDKFPIQIGLKQGDALSPLLLNFALEYSITKDEVGGTCGTHGGEVFTGFWLGGSKARDHWEDLGVGGRITLRWTLDIEGLMGRTGFGWLRIGSSGGLL
jgi:hypothetical protein